MLSVLSLAAIVSAVPFQCLIYNKNDCRSFDLVRIPTDKVEHAMKYGNNSNVPEGLELFHGLWYMDGNRVRDEVMSFAGATVWPHAPDTWEMKVYDEKVWSFSPGIRGRALYAQVRQMGFTWRITKVNETAFLFTPVFQLPAVMLNLKFPISKHITKFMLLKTSDPDVWWSTKNWFHTGKGKTFKFMRIVDGNGQRTPRYEVDYLTNMFNPDKIKHIDLTRFQLMAVLDPKSIIREQINAAQASKEAANAAAQEDFEATIEQVDFVADNNSVGSASSGRGVEEFKEDPEDSGSFVNPSPASTPAPLFEEEFALPADTVENKSSPFTIN